MSTVAQMTERWHFLLFGYRVTVQRKVTQQF
jgi:hypothetical protein